ncbi:MAG: mannose-6-phosphate isomerase, class I, partial [Propionicimonas sp.]
MQPLQGTVQHYPWGTTDAIPALLGVPADGRPFAEYWLGAHRLAPSVLDGSPLDEVLRLRPDYLGPAPQRAFGTQLSFLMKVLSARHALSVQAHPSREQAEDGFARENAAGIALDAPERTYRDTWPKPEILIAIDEFHTLSGFREPLATAELFDQLGVAGQLSSIIGPLTARKGPAALAEVFLDVLSLSGDRARLFELVCAAAMEKQDAPGELGAFARTVIELDEVFPADPGILAALLLNRVVLQPGEALYVPAGVLHAHLRGTGVEVMGNSDNVIRGGLTNKHVDVGELVGVVEFAATEPQIVRPEAVSPGVTHYPTPCPEFDVWRIAPDGARTLVPGDGSARVVLVLSGTLELHQGGDTVSLGQGGAAFLPAQRESVIATGDGLAFLTASG